MIGVSTYHREGKRVLEIDTSKAIYQEKDWKDCSEYQKRKYENLVFIENSKDRVQLKFVYI